MPTYDLMRGGLAATISTEGIKVPFDIQIIGVGVTYSFADSNGTLRLYDDGVSIWSRNLGANTQYSTRSLSIDVDAGSVLSADFTTTEPFDRPRIHFNFWYRVRPTCDT